MQKKRSLDIFLRLHVVNNLNLRFSLHLLLGYGTSSVLYIYIFFFVCFLFPRQHNVNYQPKNALYTQMCTFFFFFCSFLKGRIHLEVMIVMITACASHPRHIQAFLEVLQHRLMKKSDEADVGSWSSTCGRCRKAFPLIKSLTDLIPANPVYCIDHASMIHPERLLVEAVTRRKAKVEQLNSCIHFIVFYTMNAHHTGSAGV